MSADCLPHSDPRFPNGPPMNGCARCHRDFASLTAFDEHRGVDRRCDDLEESPEWLQDSRGRWTTRKRATKASETRAFFAEHPKRAVPDAVERLGAPR